MKNTKVYVDFITEKLKKLLSIDSPTGYTKNAVAWLKAEYEAMPNIRATAVLSS